MRKLSKSEYYHKAKTIWEKYVPKNGQAKYVQGELLRAIEKLRDEAHRNGNINFNKNCHVILIAYLREYLCDNSLFETSTLDQINSDLDRLLVYEQPYLDDDLFDRINHRIVDWHEKYQLNIVHKKNPKLYC
jgi:hypothetical protein